MTLDPRRQFALRVRCPRCELPSLLKVAYSRRLGKWVVIGFSCRNSTERSHADLAIAELTDLLRSAEVDA